MTFVKYFQISKIQRPEVLLQGEAFFDMALGLSLSHIFSSEPILTALELNNCQLNI